MAKKYYFLPDLPAIVGNSQPGKEYQVDLVRNKKNKTIKVVLSNREARDEISAATSAPIYIDILAVKVRNLTSEERTKLVSKIKTKVAFLTYPYQTGIRCRDRLTYWFSYHRVK